MKNKYFPALLCIVIAALLLAACADPAPEVPRGVVEITAEPTKEPELTPEPTEAPSPTPEGDSEGIPLTEEEREALLRGPDWEGVYVCGEKTAILRDRDGDLITLGLELGGEEDFAAHARVQEGFVSYDRETCSVYLTLSEDGKQLTVEVDGAFPILDADPEGVYTRTEEDPQTHPVAFAPDRLPGALSETVLNGRIVMVYVDPQGRFSATVPSVFSSAPTERQPEDGVCLVSGDEKCIAQIVVSETDVTAPEQAAEAAKELYIGAEVSVRDGCAVAEWSYEDRVYDEWSDVIVMRPENGRLITVEYAYRTDAAEQYGQYRDLLTIAVS